MAKYTLLELVQSILSSVDGDEVNSIDDTQEATQVALSVRDTYNDIVARLSPPEHYTLFELEASGDSSKPTLMYLPSTCLKLEWIKYNNYTTDEGIVQYVDVQSKDLNTFMLDMYNLRTSESNVGTFSHTIGADAIDFFYTNDAFPSYYTTFDDYTLVFDSYDSDEDTTLQKSKTVAYGLLSPTWTQSDSFIPDLDEKLFPLLLNEAKVLVHAEQRQVDHPVARRRARGHWIKTQQDKKAVQQGATLDQYPHYGRKR